MPLREHLATADGREVVVIFEAGGTPYRLILPHGRTVFKLEVAQPDDVQVGRPWILRWSRLAVGRRVGVMLVSTLTEQDEDLPTELPEAIKQALRYVESGPASGKIDLSH